MAGFSPNGEYIPDVAEASDNPILGNAPEARAAYQRLLQQRLGPNPNQQPQTAADYRALDATGGFDMSQTPAAQAQAAAAQQIAAKRAGLTQPQSLQALATALRAQMGQ